MALSALLILLSFLVLMQGGYAQTKSFTFTASPSLLPSNRTSQTTLTLECHLEESNDEPLFMALGIKKNGVETLGQLYSKTPEVQKTTGRTTVEGKLQQGGGNLKIVIEKPSVEDSANYSCNYVYISKSIEVKKGSLFADAIVEATESDEVPKEIPVLPTDVPSACACSDVKEEIKILRDMVEALHSRDDETTTTAQAPTTARVPAVQPASSDNDQCKVSFSVNFKKLDGHPVTNNLKGYHMKFNNVISNKGGAYSISSGFFTAPCDGQYFFTLTLRTDQDMDAGRMDGAIMVGQNEMARTCAFTDYTEKHKVSATNGVVVSLRQGQKVNVALSSTSSGSLKGKAYSIFSGFYLSR